MQVRINKSSNKESRMNKTNKKIIASTLVALEILASVTSSEVAIEHDWDNIDNEVVSKVDNNVFSNNDDSTSFYEDFMNRRANIKTPKSKLFEQLLNNIINKANSTKVQQVIEDNISNNTQQIEEIIEDNGEIVTTEEKTLENLEETEEFVEWDSWAFDLFDDMDAVTFLYSDH